MKLTSKVISNNIFKLRFLSNTFDKISCIKCRIMNDNITPEEFAEWCKGLQDEIDEFVFTCNHLEIPIDQPLFDKLKDEIGDMLQDCVESDDEDESGPSKKQNTEEK